ncbi:DUF6891 domain-containing protein [Streptomyces gilvosporeus]|uniref:DUF6891 domain-containing protein n=1 Tax=Streptomyces gilvosporeus TaxID=553510 RepID=A0A1V0U324_9ACTN|nr:hypothetical protein [Streptomyces gilvosporeus]ARF59398.1 hypothetical protein B1H19_12940 [Streptomyces gilvosporeus]
MLTITVQTETGPDLERPTEAELAALLRRIGADDDHFAVVERIPGEDQVFLQTWREGDGPFAVEYRDGGPERHFSAECTDADRVIAVFADWARGGETWRTALEWRPADLYGTPGLAPETRAEAEERARQQIRAGFWGFHQVAQGVCDVFDPADTPVSLDEARRIVGGLWEERLAEQETWPEVTDADRVAEAFAVLERQGLTARMNFTCCSGCGLAEIGGERTEGDHGFVFFHYQDTDAAADGGGLSVRYGAYADAGRDRAEVGRTVAAALSGAGLPVEWDGSPDNVIEVTPLDWRKRLPTNA